MSLVPKLLFPSKNPWGSKVDTPQPNSQIFHWNAHSQGLTVIFILIVWYIDKTGLYTKLLPLSLCFIILWGYFQIIFFREGQRKRRENERMPSTCSDNLIFSSSLNGGIDSYQGINWAILNQRYCCLMKVPSRLIGAQSLKTKCSDHNLGFHKKDTFCSVVLKCYLRGLERRW